MNSPSRWRVEVTPRAERELKRLSPRDQRRVRAGIDALTAFPRQGDLRKLQARENEWSLRVGNWRVLFRPDARGHVIVVLRVLPRSRAYR